MINLSHATGLFLYPLKTYFLSGFLSQTLTSNRTAGEGRGPFTLPISPTNEHTDIYLELCMWGDCNVFLIKPLVITRLLLNKIYELIDLSFDWLMMECKIPFVYSAVLLLCYLFQQFDVGNRWIWTQINYHPCITSKPTKCPGGFLKFSGGIVRLTY